PRQTAIPPVTLRCSLDCAYRLRLEKLATHATVAELYGRAFVRTPVKLGRSSVNTIEIINGLEPGDQVILSDTSSMDAHERIRLN
ncbi:MAG: hypothetical protein ABR582_17095, partial [Gemmatimonadaceae bacterium]